MLAMPALALAPRAAATGCPVNAAGVAGCRARPRASNHCAPCPPLALACGAVAGYAASADGARSAPGRGAACSASAIPAHRGVTCRRLAGALPQEPQLPLQAPLASATPRWRRYLGTMQRNGVGYFFSYGLVSNVNGCLLLAISWALFVRTRGTSPVAVDPGLPLVANVLLACFKPARMDPKFLLYYGAVYLSVGSVMRPLRIGLAASLVPLVRGFFDFVQVRLRCPRPVTWLVAFVSLTGLSAALFPTAVIICCFLLQVRVLA